MTTPEVTTAPASPPPLAAIAPYDWLVLDIETADGRPEQAERWCRIEWSPNPNLKPDTIGRKYLDALAGKKERLALLDESPVIIVSLKSDTELRLVHHLQAHAPRVEHGALVEGFATQREMLVALRRLLDLRVAPETTIAGHNIRQFDLPKLRWAYLAEGLRLPIALGADAVVFDTMLEYGRRYSLHRDLYIALDDLLATAGIPSHKALVSGDQVPELYRRGQYDLLIQYALLDVLTEADLFQRMTGLHPALG